MKQVSSATSCIMKADELYGCITDEFVPIVKLSLVAGHGYTSDLPHAWYHLTSTLYFITVLAEKNEGIYGML